MLWCCACFVVIASFGKSVAAQQIPADQLAFFEARIRPALVEHCYTCHSARAEELKGGLRLDYRGGWESGGDSGLASIVPGDSDSSLLIQSIRHQSNVSPMPPGRPKLPSRIIADFEQWVKMGAPDPRIEATNEAPGEHAWETRYAERMAWWSLQPLEISLIPDHRSVGNAIDCFLQSRMAEQDVKPTREADPYALVRRLSVLLVGLPPSEQLILDFANDARPDATQRLVDKLLSDPRFGERWARHWLDIVHYSDTHGYEWDAPAKNAWMYRDYVVRAFNSDLPIRNFLLEQLAGDLLQPRVDVQHNVIETLIAPMALRLGERRHGDNADAEGISQEAMSNVIDTVGKGFLGTTIACAQCHDHKLDPISQSEYYSLSGMFMSSRWSPRCVDAEDRNTPVIRRLADLKQRLRNVLADHWLNSRDSIAKHIRTLPQPDKRDQRFPETIIDLWFRQLAKPLSVAEFAEEVANRKRHNQSNIKLVADFASGSIEDQGGWQWDGAGMRTGLAQSGDFVIAEEGDRAITHILPAGRWSHLWSSRMAGAVRSPLFEREKGETFSIQCAGDRHAGYTFVVDQAFHSERLKYLSHPVRHWLTQTVGEFKTLEGSMDGVDRRIYFEFTTKALNNYFPPRTGYGGVTEAIAADPHSWFGITRVYAHPKGKAPQDELGRLIAIVERPGDLADSIADSILKAIAKWKRGDLDDESALLLDDAVRSKLLPNELKCHPQVEQLVGEFRNVQSLLVPDKVVGSMSDWNEGRDDAINIRGSYTDLGHKIPRGRLSLLDAFQRDDAAGGHGTSTSVNSASGRLEFAEAVASDGNHLTARVFVNRVWHYLFGEGLVRTPDDFGHLGEPPLHPELLDYLTQRFVQQGWSLKWLIRTIVTSDTWRQSSEATPDAVAVDPENRLWHHFPPRRLEAEVIRDSLLAVSGSLDRSIGGPPIDPYRTAQDAAKRLFSGPLDGHGRRGLYIKMTLMEPPRFLALFNQPIPKLTTGRRDVTTVPDQSLAMLNDPFVVMMAQNWSKRLATQSGVPVSERLRQMFLAALSRPATEEDLGRLSKLMHTSARLRGVDDGSINELVWQDLAHALFNLKEFIHVR